MQTMIKKDVESLLNTDNLNVTISGIHQESDLCQASRLERHVWYEAKKHNLDYEDLLYATITIAAKYKGLEQEETFYSSLVSEENKHNEHLWHEAYWCALAEKKERWEKWKHFDMDNFEDILKAQIRKEVYDC